MEKNSNKGLLAVIIVMFLVIVGLVVYIVMNSADKKEKVDNKEEVKEENNSIVEETETSDEIKEEDLSGTYYWEKSYVNEYGNEMNLKVKLVLDSDGSATYDASSGYDYESTEGTFIYNEGKIIYTREYFNYDGGSKEKYTDSNKTVSFSVIDQNTLQHTYHENVTELKKQKSVQ